MRPVSDREGGRPARPEAMAATEPMDPQERSATRATRPLLERLGLAAIALVMAGMFALIAVAGWSGGELFLAVMGGVGALMTGWAGALTLFRG